jgi:hypothetical protein
MATTRRAYTSDVDLPSRFTPRTHLNPRHCLPTDWRPCSGPQRGPVLKLIVAMVRIPRTHRGECIVFLICATASETIPTAGTPQSVADPIFGAIVEYGADQSGEHSSEVVDEVVVVWLGRRSAGSPSAVMSRREAPLRTTSPVRTQSSRRNAVPVADAHVERVVRSPRGWAAHRGDSWSPPTEPHQWSRNATKIEGCSMQ